MYIYSIIYIYDVHTYYVYTYYGGSQPTYNYVANWQ